MKAWLLPLFFVLALGLAACGSTPQQTIPLTKENVEKVKEGMTVDEVKSILGEPAETKTGDISTPMGTTVSGTTFTYRTDKNVLSISFVDGKVAIMGTNMQ